MRRRPNKSAAVSTSHTAPDPAEFNAVWRTKPNLLSQTNSNATPMPCLLAVLIMQLGSAHEWRK